jgi:hypothetical protein
LPPLKFAIAAGIATVVVFAVSPLGNARAEDSSATGLAPGLQHAFDSGYERGAADALEGRNIDAALTQCERRKKDAEDLVVLQQPYMDRGDKFGQCLREIRDAEPYGVEAMKAIVSRCTSAFP